MNSHYSLSEAFEFLQLVALNDTHFYTFIIGAVITLLAPLFLFVYLGVRLLFKTPRINPMARNGMWFLTGIGIILLIAASINFGVNMQSKGHYTTTQKLPALTEGAMLTLHMDSISDFMLDNDRYWVNLNGRNVISDIRFDIEKSMDSTSYLETRIRANGSSYRNAAEISRNVIYTPEFDSAKIELPYYFTLPEGMKYKMQEVNVTLFLKEGESVYLDHEIMQIGYDIKNQNNYWDWDMPGHVWKMEKDGLICTDCPDIPEKTTETNDIQIDDDTESVKVQIDENGIKVEVKEKDTSKSNPTPPETPEPEEAPEETEVDLDLAAFMPNVIPSFRGVLTHNFVVRL